MDKIIRVKGSTVFKLQRLKKDMGVVSYDKVIAALVDNHLKFEELAEDFNSNAGFTKDD